MCRAQNYKTSINTLRRNLWDLDRTRQRVLRLDLETESLKGKLIN